MANKDAIALANVLQNMVKQNEKSTPLNVMNLAMADEGPSDPVYLPLDLPCLPLSTMAHVDAFENLLSNEVYFRQVVSSFRTFASTL